MTHKILLDQNYLRKILDYDPNTGQFTRLVRKGGAKIGNKAGILSHGYLRIKINKKRYAAHRLAWLYVYGVWPTNHIDHIDGDKINNRINNLRDVNHATNMQNQHSAQSGNKSGFLGVSKNSSSNNFSARINVNGKRIQIGTYPTPEDAYSAYLSAKLKYHVGYNGDTSVSGIKE